MFLEVIGGIYQNLIAILALNWWWLLPLVLFFIFWDLWLYYIRIKHLLGIKWKFLEIKVPRDVLKTPKAMELIFSAIHGSYSFGFTFWEKYWEGQVEPWMSFELVGSGGGSYFYIRVPENFRNMVESAIYSQYPNAEISEKEDYTELLPQVLPNKTYDLWGADFAFLRENGYPIRTYEFYEDKEEERRLDPIANVLEVMSNLKDDEFIWLQFLVRPTDDSWKKKAEELINKLIGKKNPKEQGFMEWLGIFMVNLIKAPFEHPTWPESKNNNAGPVNLIQFLTSGEKDVIKAIENKISKLGFETNIRFIYIDKRDSFSRQNVAAVIGAFRQFNTQNLNGFKINLATYTKARHPFKSTKLFLRKRRLFDLYKLRFFPRKHFILNIEELATIYHFPSVIVEAPMLKRLESKKGEPPSSLPVE